MAEKKKLNEQSGTIKQSQTQQKKEALAVKKKLFSGNESKKGITNDIRITKPKK